MSNTEQIKYAEDGTALLSPEIQECLEDIKTAARAAAQELIESAGLCPGDILVVGCSTSEVTGNTIGHASVPAVARAVFEGIYEPVKQHGIYLAAQCCEHLNRALIIERECAEKYG